MTEPLTNVQLVFLLDAAKGLTAAESARRYGVTEDTVRNALKAVRRKLGALSTTHAVALALARGIIRLDAIELKGI